MNKEIVLTPEQLYYMGRFLQAKYIDYAYVAAMSDIKQNYALFEKETRNSMIASGYIMEDFSGNIEVDQKIVDLLNPIFFGEVETSLDICDIGKENKVSVYKFHFHDGVVTMVTGDNGKLVIKAVDRMAIHDFVSNILAENYNGKFEVVKELDKDQISRFIAVKSIIVGHTAVVKTYIESNEVIYCENEENFESLTRDMFIKDAYDVVKGV